MNIGIDLLWVRHGMNGGTETYINNILMGFQHFAPDKYTFHLYVAEANKEEFSLYIDNKRFVEHVCNCDSTNQMKRVLWESFNLNKIGRINKIDLWYYPVYSRPFWPPKDIPNVTVIHDLQGLHYPEYFSRIRNIFFRAMWKKDTKTATRIVTVSNFCKKDIVKHYHISVQKVKAIYPVLNVEGETTDFEVLQRKYGIEKNNYYYTLSSLAKHKNLITLLKAFKYLKENGKNYKLVITGVKINAANEIFEFIEKNHLTNNVIYTGYISNADRNALYANCRKFLFSSIFEGFGVPPIEASIRGVPVLTTNQASLKEVTMGMCDYVDDPFSVSEWAEKIPQTGHVLSDEQKNTYRTSYGLETITKQYLKLFDNLSQRE